MSDFNPCFSFAFGDDETPAQAPWKFENALAQAEQVFGTSIDHKIKQRLGQRKGPGRIKSTPKPLDDSIKDTEESDPADTESDEEIEEDISTGETGSDEDSDDRPLPGEEDSDDSEELQQKHASQDEHRSEKGTFYSDKESDSQEEGDDDGEDINLNRKRNRTRNGLEENCSDRGHQKKPRSLQAGYFDAVPRDTKFSAESFAALNLSRPLTRACATLGYDKPTPIQAACIPLALTGRDICGSAITGSGKTAAFSLPLLERLLHRNRRVAAIYVLVLCPTRELAVQVHSMMQQLGQYTDIRVSLVVGGLSLQAQAAALRSHPEVVVATPGRLIDHLRNSQGFGIEDLAALVLDEADRLLEMGFAEEVREIVRLAPASRQTMLFSATMTEAVKDLATLSLRHPVRLAADATLASPKNLSQEVIRLRGAAATAKEATLLALVSRTLSSDGRTIIFFSTKHQAHRAKILFGLAGLPAAAELHGDMTQSARLESLENFRVGRVSFLLATDVAARGLDILGVETVVNFDCPKTISTYLHRIGRTARAGASGRSITFVEDMNHGLLKDLVKKAGVVLQQRKLPVASVSQWQEKIEEMEEDVRRIYDEEAEERALRKAEMEAAKATNMLEHSDEILSRPARTWFLTESQKKEIAQNARRESPQQNLPDAELLDGSSDALSEPVQRKIDKNVAKSARRMERKLNAAKEAAKEATMRKKNVLMEETRVLTGRIKAAKARASNLREEGMPATKAGRIAASMVSEANKKAKSKRSKIKLAKLNSSEVSESKLGGLQDAADLMGRRTGPAKVYSGGARSAKPKSPALGNALSGAALSRVKRGGKGKHSFKSKARHKRRR